MSNDEVMASILHLAHNMDEETSAQGAPVPDAPPSQIYVRRCWSRFTRRPRTHPAGSSWWSWPPQQVQRIWQPGPHHVLMQCP
jgi:hypothetical protein